MAIKFWAFWRSRIDKQIYEILFQTLSTRQHLHAAQDLAAAATPLPG
jgi:hypothetical protein